MTVPFKHIRHQGRTLRTLGSVALQGARQQLGLSTERGAPTLPGPEQIMTLEPPPPDLVRDFIRHVGGDPAAYKKTLPPHLFSQWSFAAAERTQRNLPYPLFKMVNGGCRLDINGPLPQKTPLRVAARLEDIDDNGRRVILNQRVATGTAETPELLVAHIYAVIPLATKRKGGERKQRPLVPIEAQEVAYWKLPVDAGLDFALLTGDFNPLHWIPAYARAFGFRSTIMHGFATMARAYEGLTRGLFSGDPSRITRFDARFTKPLLLPGRAGLYVSETRQREGAGTGKGQASTTNQRKRHVFIGEAPGGTAYLTGSFISQDQRSE